MQIYCIFSSTFWCHSWGDNKKDWRFSFVMDLLEAKGRRNGKMEGKNLHIYYSGFLQSFSKYLYFSSHFWSKQCFNFNSVQVCLSAVWDSFSSKFALDSSRVKFSQESFQSSSVWLLLQVVVRFSFVNGYFCFSCEN